MVSVQPDSDGWIEWNGADRGPIHPTVQVKFRDGEVSDFSRPKHWVWKHYNCAGDIIAYRVVTR